MLKNHESKLNWPLKRYNMTINYIELDNDQIDSIRPLWEKLREHNREL